MAPGVPGFRAFFHVSGGRFGGVGVFYEDIGLLLQETTAHGADSDDHDDGAAGDVGDTGVGVGRET